MGHVERKNAKSGYRYYPVIKLNGKKEYHGGHKRRKDAETRLRLLEKEVADGTYKLPKPKQYTFTEWYLHWIKGKEKSLKRSSYVSYEHTFRNHISPFFGETPLYWIDADMVQDWVDHICVKDLAPATVRRAYRYLRACLRKAHLRGHIKQNPCVEIDLPRIERGELEFLRPQEVRSLLNASREPERTLLSVLAYSGLRLGEGLALCWKNIDFKNMNIHVERSYSYFSGITEPKTESSRRAVPLLPILEGILKDYYHLQDDPSPDDLLFSCNGEKPLDPANVRKQMIKALKAANLKYVTIHSLRHTFASVLLDAGASIKALQRALGHKSAAFTLDVYSHLLSENLGPAAMKADSLFSA